MGAEVPTGRSNGRPRSDPASYPQTFPEPARAPRALSGSERYWVRYHGTLRAVHALRLLEGIVYEVETGGDRTFYDVYAALEAAEEACRIARGRVAAKARGRA